MRRTIVFAVVILVLASLTCSYAQVSTTITGDKADKVLFERARSAIFESRYADARALLVDLIKNHPDSDYVPGAKLSIGDAWYAEGNLKRAALEYEDFVTFFPNRPEVAATKLKIEAIQKLIRM